MRKILIVFISLILYTVNSYAGPGINDITIKTFIKSAEKDFRLEIHKELTEFLETAKTNTPYFDKIELRTESNEFDLMKQRYAVRFYPKGWGEAKYSNNVIDSLKTIDRTGHNAKFNKSVRFRYNLILEYLNYVKLIENKKNLISVYTEKVNIIKENGKVVDLVRAEDDLMNTRLSMIELQNLKTGVIRDINEAALSKANVYFDNEKLKTISEIEEDVSIISEKSGLENVDLIVKRNMVELEKNKYMLEKAKNKKYVTFIQGAYDTDFAEDFDKAYSVKLGVRLPFINPDREDINNMKVGYIGVKFEYEDVKRDIKIKINSLSRAIGRNIRQYRVLAQFIKNRITVIKSEKLEPLDVLAFREATLENETKLLKLEAEILAEYIGLIDAVGELSTLPLQNYLVKVQSGS